MSGESLIERVDALKLEESLTERERLLLDAYDVPRLYKARERLWKLLTEEDDEL